MKLSASTQFPTRLKPYITAISLFQVCIINTTISRNNKCSSRNCVVMQDFVHTCDHETH